LYVGSNSVQMKRIEHLEKAAHGSMYDTASPQERRTIDDFNNIHNIAQSQKAISIKDLIIEVNKRIGPSE
jgi:hypothetical protein